MKTKTIRKLFLQLQETILSSFSLDESLRGDSQFLSVHRPAGSGQWQFFGLSFVPQRHKFFLEIAISSSSAFPLNAGLSYPSDSLKNGTIRIRANELWSNSHCSEGWVIFETDPDPDDETKRIVGDPEGIFRTNEAAVESLKLRIEGWGLPYLDKLRG